MEYILVTHQTKKVRYLENKAKYPQTNTNQHSICSCEDIKVFLKVNSFHVRKCYIDTDVNYNAQKLTHSN